MHKSGGLLFDDCDDRNGAGWRPSDQRREEEFVTNSMLEHSTHSESFKKSTTSRNQV